MTAVELLEACGIDAITADTGLPVIEDRLRALAGSLNGDNPLRRATIRQMVIDKLRAAKIAAAAGLVDAALTAPKGAPRHADHPKDVEPWPDPVDLPALLEDLVAWLRSYVHHPEPS